MYIYNIYIYHCVCVCVCVSSEDGRRSTDKLFFFPSPSRIFIFVVKWCVDVLPNCSTMTILLGVLYVSIEKRR